MICINCGKFVKGSVCECCGTDYRTDEERKKSECEHFYDSMRREYDVKHCAFRLSFRCCKCGEVLTIRTDRFVFDNLFGG